MKKILLPALFIFSVVAARAQVTSLHENFDVSCATSSGFPLYWISHNPVAGTFPFGAWGCGPGEGNGGTPGMMVTGNYGSPASYHTDTAYLITPLLDLSSVTGPLYLRFDTKTTKFHSGGKFALIAARFPDSTIANALLDSDVTTAMSPVFSNADSTGWVTHEVSLTSYIGTSFYISFSYISTDTSGSTWFLDNVSTTTSRLGISNPANTTLPLTVIGNSTPDEISLSCSIEMPGAYQIMVYDLMGREVYKETLNAESGPAIYRINGLNLRPGMYLVKMGNENTYGTAKFVVQ